MSNSPTLTEEPDWIVVKNEIRTIHSANLKVFKVFRNVLLHFSTFLRSFPQQEKIGCTQARDQTIAGPAGLVQEAKTGET